MIIQETEKVNRKISIKIKKYEEQLNITSIKCPNCESSEYEYYGSYIRNILYLEKEKLIEKTIKIKRIRCQGCGKTHAIIPDFIIPYKQHELKLINKVLKEKMSSKKVTEISKNNKVSRQLINKWIKSFQKIKAKVETMLVVFDMKKLGKEIIKMDNMIKKYYKQYKEIYMCERVDKFYNYTPT